ncbi:mannan-binding lectin [Desulfovibrio sp. OttesenSCG-928-F20]|nr:mannan-binding lectin [Desulfovibrio sp. OttesenSCG-928-F20]
MKLISRIILTCCLLLLTAVPALAKVSVTFINRTDFEIQSIYMTGDAASMSSGLRVVPGNFCVLTDGGSSELREIKIDVGLMLFTFTNMSALAGLSSPTLELIFDADNRPHLTLVDKPGQTGSDSEDESFDLPAGPIWDNEHAKERCPQVLEEWLVANPGKEARWNGNWATVESGRMSVCGITVSSGGRAIPSLINIVGEATLFVDPSTPAATDFSAVINAGSMTEIRDMGAQEYQEPENRLLLPASFAGKTWAVFLEPANPDAKPGACSLRTYTGSDDLAPLMQGLAAAGYRPWCAQLAKGEDMDIEAMVRFWQEEFDREEAWEQMTDACEDINRGDSPAAVDIVLLSDEGYARAAKGEDAQIPGLRLRISNAVVITLQYLPDVSMLLSMTR